MNFIVQFDIGSFIQKRSKMLEERVHPLRIKLKFLWGYWNDFDVTSFNSKSMEYLPAELTIGTSRKRKTAVVILVLLRESILIRSLLKQVHLTHG